MNSLKNIIGVGDWIASILLLLKSPQFSKKIFFTLEGESDIRFMNTYFSSNKIHYDSPCSGKPEVINAVSDLRSQGKNSVYGICDADFDTLEGRTYDNIHFTDCHDLEMMLIEGGAFDKFISEFLKVDNLREAGLDEIKSALKETLIETTYKIGILKWVNHKFNLSLMFRGMNYNTFINFDGFKANINIEKYIKHILSRSPNKPANCDYDYLLEKYNNLILENADYRYICNGHDFTYLIMIAFRSDYSRDRNISKDRVETHLRMGYSLESFRTTQVYNHMTDILSLHDNI